ncbi:MAG: T9SS C-terminal target domain-containing protein, partial [Methanobacteriota archaeon]
WNFPIVDGLSIQVYNTPDQLDTATIILADTSQVSWLQGAALPGTPTTSIFNQGIDFVWNVRPSIADGLTKDKYFPVKLVIDSTFAQNTVAQRYFTTNWRLTTNFLQPSVLKAFDVTDPANPRQLNVAYLESGPPTADRPLDFSGETEIVIFTSDYDPNGRYQGTLAGSDSLFKAESYLICSFEVPNDSLRLINPVEVSIKPHYPNSDKDVYRIEGQTLQPKLRANEAKSLLEKVNVVPNPYFATSRYETSFDTPILRFTHLPSERVTIRIFNLAGQLVKVLEKDDTSNEIRWDLKNTAGLKIASGMYIAHVRAHGVGDKVLKFMVVQREERIDRF